jgi:hypothetical protein
MHMTAEITAEDLSPITAADVIAAFDLNDAGEVALEALVAPSVVATANIFAVQSAQDVASDMIIPQVQIVSDLLGMMESSVSEVDMGYDDMQDTLPDPQMIEDTGMAM